MILQERVTNGNGTEGLSENHTAGRSDMAVVPFANVVLRQWWPREVAQEGKPLCLYRLRRTTPSLRPLASLPRLRASRNCRGRVNAEATRVGCQRFGSRGAALFPQASFLPRGQDAKSLLA